MQIQLKILNKVYYRDYPKSYDADTWVYKDLPTYATDGSAAIDLVCCEDVTIYPGETKAIHTGLAIWIRASKNSNGYNCVPYCLHVAGLILPRSGLGTKGLVLANTIGLIDEDYQGELIVKAWNRNNEYRTIDRYSNEGSWQEIEWDIENKIELKAGDRFTQLMFVPIIRAQFNVVEEFANVTERGSGRYGSTGR